MAVSTHREIERKYDVADDVPLPSLLDLPGVAGVGRPVEHRLEAVYFDTPDLALAGVGITLRRRTGGPDAGWHLKRPLGADRQEQRRPLGRSTRNPPEALLTQVRAQLRHRKTAAVATLSTRRVVHLLLDDKGRVLAEVADDTVTARTPTDEGKVSLRAWREWEVELVDGDRTLLDAAEERLVEAGARPAAGPSKLARALGDRLPDADAPAKETLSRKSSAGAVLQAHLREQAAELTLRDPEVRRDEADAVHKMRVATRRLRSALATFRPLLGREVTGPLREELKWLATVLGEARDAEVMRDRLVSMVEDEPPELVLGPVARRIGVELRDTYRTAHTSAVETLDSDRYFRLLDALDALVQAPPWTEVARRPAREVLPGRVLSSWKRLRRDAGRVEDARTAMERDRRLHEARKSAKRARYAGEALIPVFGRPAKKFAKAIKDVQETLGEHQDSVVTRALLRQIGVQAYLDGENAFTYGRLHALEQAHAADTETRYAAAWRRAKAPSLRRWTRP